MINLFLAMLLYYDITVRTELHQHPVVPTLQTYIQWKMEGDHTYHKMKVHDNTIHHMVLTTYLTGIVLCCI